MLFKDLNITILDLFILLFLPLYSQETICIQFNKFIVLEKLITTIEIQTPLK